VIAVVGAALVGGVAFGRLTAPSSSTRSSTAIGAASGSAAARSTDAQPAAGAPEARTPSAPSATTSLPAQAGTVDGHVVLLNISRQTGPMITQHFTVTGPRWTLGWAYDCTGAPGGTGAFNIKVFDGNGDSSSDGGIDQNGAKGSSVVAYTSMGERYLWVTTNCVWAVRVTS
jgi:hypothetical protein